MAEETTFEESLELARTIMRMACADAGRMLGEKAPELMETVLPNGTVRIVVRWPDGEETNECLVERLEKGSSFPA